MLATYYVTYYLPSIFLLKLIYKFAISNFDLRIYNKDIIKIYKNAIITRDRTVPVAIWQKFSEYFIFYDLLHEPLGKWNKSKIWETKKVCHIARRCSVWQILSLARIKCNTLSSIKLYNMKLPVLKKSKLTWDVAGHIMKTSLR